MSKWQSNLARQKYARIVQFATYIVQFVVGNTVAMLAKYEPRQNTSSIQRDIQLFP